MAVPCEITVETPSLALFSPMLQQGVTMKLPLGVSVKSLLCDHLGLSSDYVDQRIKTVFLGGKPVDDYATALVTEKAVLALSAAMPGLVGATFRSGGILSPFRSGISFRNPEMLPGGETHGFVTIKLFNLLVGEIGPGLLAHGIWMDAAHLLQLAALLEDSLPKSPPAVTVNGSPVEPRKLESALPAGDTLLRVRVTQCADS